MNKTAKLTNAKASFYDYIIFSKHNCPDCEVCPLSRSNNGTGFSCKIFMGKYPDKANKIILDWIAAHQQKTRQTEFLKLFPEAELDSEGYINLAPCNICSNYNCPSMLCENCRRYFWSTPIE